MSLAARRAMGLRGDPWKGPLLETADAARCAEAAGAARAGALAVVWGPRGSGKTAALRAALRGDATVEPLRLDRERLTVGDVLAALVRELSAETPRHSAEARAVQARRLLGAADRMPVLWIDDAHHLHHRTLAALKRLREWSWRGRSPLLGVLLSGQADRTESVPEVGLRADRVPLAGLSASEALAAARLAMGAVAAPEAVALLASKRNWLDMRAAVDACCVEALARGERSVTAEAARRAVGAAPARSPRRTPTDEQVAARLAAGDR